MGRDKLSLMVGGKPLLERVADALREVCEELVLVGLPEAETGDRVDFRMVRDLREGGLGPLAGLEAGMTAARSPLVFVAAGDMPFLNPQLAEALLGRLETGDAQACVPRYDGRIHPLCAAYQRELLPLVDSALDAGVRAMGEFLGGLERVEYTGDMGRFGAPELVLMNVNSPEDLDLARKRAG
jgi:molybdopterin-guanine dinucleotide biosynthesis protein A